MLRKLTVVLLCVLATFAHATPGNPSGAEAFNQLGEALPTANVYRTASGAPGERYWQQRADYTIRASLEEDARRITASSTIDYHNHSPDTLRYLWLQLDQNRFANDSLDRRSRTITGDDTISYSDLRFQHSSADTAHGYQNIAITDTEGNPLAFKIVDTLLRIDLEQALKPDETFTFNVDWAFNIINEVAIGGRGGYEYFEDSDTELFFLAQWFPRMVAYSDYDGWHNKAFLGRGEFTLEFGDYNVFLTVPNNHVVSSTGVLNNPTEVLTRTQQQRLASANEDAPVFIVTPEEAIANEQTQATGTQTWHFKAANVRDFAWASSSKFIWDAMTFSQPEAEHTSVLAMSFYPIEAQPIWAQYSTHAVVHTLEVYNRFAFDYPYPTAQSVNTWERGGMEYPMITFNGYRPEPWEKAKSADTEWQDETTTEPPITYSRRVKYGLIGVIIHEIGHIYFPMVVNSDERQWTWMDEGINSFLEYVAELEWEENYPAYRDDANILDYIPAYMTSANQVPIMTQSDSILQFGPNAYTKPAAALTVLRETVMGRELFDFAFREYAQRWKFKRPTPADFFRTMEDASGIDLDWFWRGWFYTTNHVDLAITDIRSYQLKSGDPKRDFPLDRAEAQRDKPAPISEARNRQDGITLRIDRYPELLDFYNENDRFTVSNKSLNDYQKDLDKLEPWQRRALDRALEENRYYYFVDFENLGGIPSPILLEIAYQDGSSRELTLPPEIWRRNNEEVTYLLTEDRAIEAISVDKYHQTADADYRNNRFPPEVYQSRLEAYKSDRETRNLMADMLEKLKQSDKSEASPSDPVELVSPEQ